MSTYSLDGLADFILQVFDEQNENEIWETWLHKEKNETYANFKKKYLRKSNKRKAKVISKEEERANMDYAFKFIKPINDINEGGETTK